MADDFRGYDMDKTTPPPDDTVKNPWATRVCPNGHAIYTNFADLALGGCYVCVLAAARKRHAA